MPAVDFDFFREVRQRLALNKAEQGITAAADRSSCQHLGPRVDRSRQEAILCLAITDRVANFHEVWLLSIQRPSKSSAGHADCATAVGANGADNRTATNVIFGQRVRAVTRRREAIVNSRFRRTSCRLSGASVRRGRRHRQFGLSMGRPEPCSAPRTAGSRVDPLPLRSLPPRGGCAG